jgi:ubiquitin-protein ligase
MFKITIKMSPDYPETPPTATCETPIFHPNISEDGTICIDSINIDKWEPGEFPWSEKCTLPSILQSIEDILALPDCENAVNQAAANMSQHEPSEYREILTQYIDKSVTQKDDVKYTLDKQKLFTHLKDKFIEIKGHLEENMKVDPPPEK